MNDHERAEYNARKQKWRDANRDKVRAAGNKFANSEHGWKRRKEWRDGHPEKIRANTYRYRAKMTPGQRKAVARKHRNNPRTKLKHRLGEARKRAIKDGLPFEEVLYNILDNPPTHCACCKAELDYNVRGRGCRNFAPSIDRVINERGYTVANVRWICGFCNARKSDSTRDILLMIVAYINQNTVS